VPITFRPKVGMVLICNFEGFRAPEMVKTRPVVIVSPNEMHRPGLVTIVPLSTTAPEVMHPYHYKLKGSPIPGSCANDVWAKCDMICSVSIERIDRVKTIRRNYAVGYVSMDQVNEIRAAAGLSFGLKKG
jgi:uncharacterized protein YifN (PemK superfamily)